MSKTVGIDFGTNSCVVAVIEGGSPKVLPNREGQLPRWLLGVVESEMQANKHYSYQSV